jgi:hypothetical protein
MDSYHVAHIFLRLVSASCVGLKSGWVLMSRYGVSMRPGTARPTVPFPSSSFLWCIWVQTVFMQRQVRSRVVRRKWRRRSSGGEVRGPGRRCEATAGAPPLGGGGFLRAAAKLGFRAVGGGWPPSVIEEVRGAARRGGRGAAAMSLPLKRIVSLNQDHHRVPLLK